MAVLSLLRGACFEAVAAHFFNILHISTLSRKMTFREMQIPRISSVRIAKRPCRMRRILPFSASKKTLVSKFFRGAAFRGAACKLISRAPTAPPPGFEFPPGRSVLARHRTGMPLSGRSTRLWGSGAVAGPRDPLVPVKIDVHPDTDPAPFVCQNPETVLQTCRSAPGGQGSRRNRCAGPISSGRLADLSLLRGDRLWGRGLVFLLFSSHSHPRYVCSPAFASQRIP